MSIVSLESADEKNVSASILNFLTAYGVTSLLSKCGGTKLKGVPVKALFTYTLTNVFHIGSFYMKNKLEKDEPCTGNPPCCLLCKGHAGKANPWLPSGEGCGNCSVAKKRHFRMRRWCFSVLRVIIREKFSKVLLTFATI